jgi:hypothetical protein
MESGLLGAYPLFLVRESVMARWLQGISTTVSDVKDERK